MLQKVVFDEIFTGNGIILAYAADREQIPPPYILTLIPVIEGD